MGSGIIISEVQPELTNRYTWMKPLPDGSMEYYEPDDGGWTKVRTEPAKAEATHSHTELGNLNITGVLSAGGDAGLTGSKVVQGYTLTFKKGLLVGFQAP